jgi:hypothetical protein
MDRTAILGDTIDYMKELLEKINNLQQEIELDSNMTSIVKDVKPNEILIRNSPKVRSFHRHFCNLSCVVGTNIVIAYS